MLTRKRVRKPIMIYLRQICPAGKLVRKPEFCVSFATWVNSVGKFIVCDEIFAAIKLVGKTLNDLLQVYFTLTIFFDSKISDLIYKKMNLQA